METSPAQTQQQFHNEFLENCSLITPNIYLGNDVSASLPIGTLESFGITHIIVAGFGLKPCWPQNFTYLQMPLIDIPLFKCNKYFPKISKYVETVFLDWEKSLSPIIDSTTKTNESFDSNIKNSINRAEKQPVFLFHCAQGKSRSATILISWLMTVSQESYQTCYAYIRKRRPKAQPNSGFQSQLIQYEKSREKLSISETTQSFLSSSFKYFIKTGKLY